MTHWDDLSAETCIPYACMVCLLTTGGNWVDCERTLQDTRYGAERMRGAALNPTGYVVDSMMCALKMGAIVGGGRHSPHGRAGDNGCGQQT